MVQMIFLTLMMSSFMTIASVKNCRVDADSLPLRKICKSSFNRYGVECAPFETRRSRGCFETRSYPRMYWVSTKIPWKRKKKLLKSTTSIQGYIAGDNDQGVCLSVTFPTVFEFKSNNNKVENVHLSYYIPSDYQEDPPEPSSSKTVLYQSQPRLLYVKPIGFWVDKNVALEDLAGSFNQLKKELKKAIIYDVDLDHHIIFVYCYFWERKCRVELAFMQLPLIPPSPLDKVCESASTPDGPKCFRGDATEVEGTHGLVEKRTYPEATVILRYLENDKYEDGLKELIEYIYGENEAEQMVLKKLPFVSSNAIYEPTAATAVWTILKNGQSAPKPTNDKLTITKFQKATFYVLGFGGIVKGFKETYGAYFEKLCMLLDDAKVNYSKDLYLTLDYTHSSGEFRRHEVAVVALD